MTKTKGKITGFGVRVSKEGQTQYSVYIDGKEHSPKNNNILVLEYD